MKIFIRDFIFSISLISFLFGCDKSYGTNTKVERVVSENNIDALEQITLGGVEQWVSIQSEDISNPILLVLHGGPGFAMMPLFHERNRELEDHFTVVNWDQRGAGMSYSGNIPTESMTLSQFLSDAHELTEYLKTRFTRNKIFILGHSSGTIIGTFLIHYYPEDYYAYGGVGQVVNVIENEQLSYDFALEQAYIDNNIVAIAELLSIGRPNENGEYKDESGYDITIMWVSYYGGEIYGKRNSEEIEMKILNSKPYVNQSNKITTGWDFSQILFNDNAIWSFDFRTSVNQVDVPVYFFTGRHDYDTPFSLVEQYYDVLSAPKKEIIWFENSAHFPFYEEPQKFNRMIIEKFKSHL